MNNNSKDDDDDDDNQKVHFFSYMTIQMATATATVT